MRIYLYHGHNPAKAGLIADGLGDESSKGVSQETPDRDELAAYQLVGGVMAYQDDDGYPV